jgi:hypothetical protein
VKIEPALPIQALFIALAFSAQAASYSGNGGSGFGGSVGSGFLDMYDSPSQMIFTLYRGPGAFNDDCVLYLDTKPGGFTSTALFSDNGDGGRTAISGLNGGNGSRTVAIFSPGFGADYAISIQNNFIGVYELVAGGNNSLNYLFGQAQSGNNLAPSYSITMTAAQLSQIHLVAGDATFYVEGSLISTTAYRSNETFGPSVTVPGDSSGNAGFSNQQTFQGPLTDMMIPEPGTAAVLGLGLAGLLCFRRRN